MKKYSRSLCRVLLAYFVLTTAVMAQTAPLMEQVSCRNWVTSLGQVKFYIDTANERVREIAGYYACYPINPVNYFISYDNHKYWKTRHFGQNSIVIVFDLRGLREANSDICEMGSGKNQPGRLTFTLNRQMGTLTWYLDKYPPSSSASHLTATYPCEVVRGQSF